MEDEARYVCPECGNDLRFRARAKSENLTVITDGHGNIIATHPEAQILDEISVIEITDCLECGGIKILDRREDLGSDGQEEDG